MRVLVDTNILIRLFQPTNESFAICNVAVNNLISNGFSLHIVPQNLYELWVIATRPVSQNGFGMNTAATYQLVDKCLEQFSLLKDEKSIFDHWLKLVHDQDRSR